MSQSLDTSSSIQVTGSSADAGPVILEFPCSGSQERLWFLDQIDPGNPALNVSVRWRLVGRVSSTTLEQAFQAVIARQEGLRTYFAERDGQPVQCVVPQVDFHLGVVDLTMLPLDERQAEAIRIGMAEAARRFRLDVAPLIRATLLRIKPDESLLLVTIHHMVFDGWSIGVLAREVGLSYQALREGRTPDLPELPIQYGDYARWQQAWLESDALAVDRDYWLKRLRDVRYYEMPSDRPRPPLQSHNGSMASLMLPRATTDRAEAFGRQHGATFFMVALAALSILLYRYTDETDIAVGTQTAGRDEVELEGLIGSFINTLILRVDVSGNPTMAGFLGHVRDTVAEALEHRNYPFERLIRQMNPPRDLSRPAVVSVNVIVQRAFAQGQSYGDFHLTGIPSHSPGALYDLNFILVERVEGWRASCEFNTDLFDADTVQAILDSWGVAIASFADHPDETLGRLNLLDDAAAVAHHTWNATAAAYPAETALPQLIEAQVQRNPNATAIVFGGQRMTHGELDAAANRFARVLRGRGVDHGSLVGICVSRSIDMVVALLGVLKLGATYLPLDPTYPEPRLQEMVRDADPVLLLTDPGFAAGPRLAGERLLTLDDVHAAMVSEDPSSLGPIARPDDTAYIIYTSGSTGRPKGVRIAHRSLVNFLWSMRQTPGLTAQDVLVGVTTISFDIAALEVFLPLLVGAQLVLATREEAADGWQLAALLRRTRATVMQATPITWQILLEAGWEGRLRMLCGGEALSRKLADQMIARGGTVWNMYGPTETTIWSAAGQVREGAEPVLIGPAIANTQLHVLNEFLAVEPVGARGELFIGGDGVAIGYKDRPDLNSERFLPDPFQNDPDARLYRTGDVVRRRADGRIEFLGRADHQIKLRGFRIELGEIEAAALRHATITAAVASLYRDPQGDDSLCLYAVADAPVGMSPEAQTRDLRNHLAALLPVQMVPASIVFLDAFPRTENGKVDRKALPAPPRDHGPQGDDVTAAEPLTEAMNETMQGLARIWRQILGVAEIHPHSNFFELGGHSLMAARMLTAVAAEYGERVSLGALFADPTVRGLARALGSDHAPDADFAVNALQSQGDDVPIIAVNNFGVFHPLVRELGNDRPFLSIYLADPDRSRPLPYRSFDEVCDEYVRVLKESRPTGPYIFMGWCISGNIAFEVARRLRAAGEDVPLVVMIDTWAPGRRKRLSPVRRFLSSMSYRAQWYLSEWRSGRRTLLQILSRGRFGRYIRMLPLPATTARDLTEHADDRYDWFIRYLDAHLEHHDVLRYDGSVLLIRTSAEPKGLFLDPALGWRDLVTGPVTVREVEGDHLGIFQVPSVNRLAEAILGSLPLRGSARRESV